MSNFNENLKNFILESEPDINIFFNLAKQYENSGQLAAAITFYLKVAEINSCDIDVAQAALINAANCYLNLGDRLGTARDMLYHALNLSDRNPFLHWMFSKVFEMQKDWIACKAHSASCISILHSNPRLFRYHELSNFNSLSQEHLKQEALFQIATSNYWMGKVHDSFLGFSSLKDGKFGEIPGWMQVAIERSLKIIEPIRNE